MWYILLFALVDVASAVCFTDCNVGEMCPNMWGRMKSGTAFTNPVGTLMNPKRLDNDDDGNPVFVIGELHYSYFKMVTFDQDFNLLKSKYISSTYAHSIATLTVSNYNSHASNQQGSTSVPCDGNDDHCAGDFSCNTLAIGSGSDRPVCNTCDDNTQCASGLECKSPGDLTTNIDYTWAHKGECNTVDNGDTQIHMSDEITLQGCADACRDEEWVSGGVQKAKGFIFNSARAIGAGTKCFCESVHSHPHTECGALGENLEWERYDFDVAWQADYHFAHKGTCVPAAGTGDIRFTVTPLPSSVEGCANACRGKTWESNGKQHSKGFAYKPGECFCSSAHSDPHEECGNEPYSLSDWTRYDFDIPYAFMHYGECQNDNVNNEVELTGTGYSIESCASACKGTTTDNGKPLGFIYKHSDGSCKCESQASHPHPDCTPNDDTDWARYDFVNYSPVFEYQHEGRCQDGAAQHETHSSTLLTGTDLEKATQCSRVCMGALINGEAAKGFVVGGSGECFCESDSSGDSPECADKVAGWKRYDFVREGVYRTSGSCFPLDQLTASGHHGAFTTTQVSTVPQDWSDANPGKGKEEWWVDNCRIECIAHSLSNNNGVSTATHFNFEVATGKCYCMQTQAGAHSEHPCETGIARGDSTGWTSYTIWNGSAIPDVPGCDHSGVDVRGMGVCTHAGDEDTTPLGVCTSSTSPLSEPCSYGEVCIDGGGTYKLTMRDLWKDGWHSRFNDYDDKFVYDNLNPAVDEGFLYIDYGEGLKGFTMQHGLASVDVTFTGLITEMFMYFGIFAEEVSWDLSCADSDSDIMTVSGREMDSNYISHKMPRTGGWNFLDHIPSCGGTSCTSSTCDAGHIYHNDLCIPNCDPGQYSSDGACTLCTDGYQDQAGQTSCKACGANEESNADGTACQCIDGYSGSPCTLCHLNVIPYTDWDSGCPAWSDIIDECICDCGDSGFSGDHCDICAKGMGWNGVLGTGAKCTVCDFPTVNDQTSHNAVCSHDFCPPGKGTTLDQNAWNRDNSTTDNCVDCTGNTVSPDNYGQCVEVMCDDYMTVKDTIDHTLNNTNQTNCEPCSGYNVGPSCLPIVCESGRMKKDHDGSGDGVSYIDYGLEPNDQDNCIPCRADEVVSSDRMTCERVVCPAGYKILVVDPTLSYDNETNCVECTGFTIAEGTECNPFDCGSNRVKENFVRTPAGTKCGEQCTGDTILDVNDLTQCVACEGDTVVNSDHTECVTAVCRAGYIVNITDRSLPPGDYHQAANCEEIDECLTATCSPCGELINGYVCTEEIELRQGIEAFANANEHICPSRFRLSSEAPDNAADIGLRGGACPSLKVFAEKLSIHEGVFRSKLVPSTANVVVEDKACKYTYEDLISATYEV